jgi:hypothetical protein
MRRDSDQFFRQLSQESDADASQSILVIGQIRTDPSVVPTAIRWPLGLNAMAVTRPSLNRAACSFPDSMSHTCTKSSLPAVASSFPSGLNTTRWIDIVSPLTTCFELPVGKCQTWTDASLYKTNPERLSGICRIFPLQTAASMQFPSRLIGIETKQLRKLLVVLLLTLAAFSRLSASG